MTLQGSEGDHQLAADAACLEASVGVGGALERVGVGDGGEYAGGHLGGELVEAVATRAHQDAVQVDVAVDGQLEVPGEVHDARGVAADPDVRQCRRDEVPHQVDDGVQLATERLGG